LGEAAMWEVLRLDNVQVNKNGIPLLNMLDICAYANEVHGIIGDFGQYREQLPYLLAGMADYSKGSIFFQGIKIEKLSVADSVKMGIKVLAPNDYFEKMSILENAFVKASLVFGWRYNKLKIIETFEYYFKLFDLKVNMNATPKHLSPMERCAVSVIISIILKAKLLIIDEYTSLFSDYDIITFQRILNYLRFCGICIICIVRRIDELTRLTDRATVVNSGRTVRIIAKTDYYHEKILAALLS